MKCQQDPEARSGEKLARWVRKNADGALKQVRGGIRTARNREFWCRHQRRGKVSFKANQIDPICGLVIVETFEEVTLSETAPLEVESVPISYLSVNDFQNILLELRTINDLIRYLKERRALCPELQRTVGVEQAIFKLYLLHRGCLPGLDSIQDILEETGRRGTEISALIRDKKASDLQAEHIERVCNALAGRIGQHEEGLDEEAARLFDPASDRSNYLLMQDELCDLVLDERRGLGACLSQIIEKVRADRDREAMVFQATHLDSKPDFLYIFSSSKGVSRNEIIKRSSELASGGMSYYGKKRALHVSYAQDRDGYEVSLTRSFVETEETIQTGKQFFSKLRMFDVPIKKV